MTTKNLRREVHMNQPENDELNTPAAPEPPRLFTISEASERLRVSRWQVYALINQRRLKTIRIGRRRLVAEPDLTALITELREEGDSL
ncbi:helix-turn-helix domain-containing protein [Amycolatopsis sp. NPDC005961]|uniref:helix-turn-helix domain-containing protein n=1 Tax=Amycolatopsis sp. NPDC005961 TaxID=3156720 RepID=UPI00340BAB4F